MREMTEATYSVSQKSSPSNTFCGIFSPGEPVKLKIFLVIAHTYLYVYANFCPFIWIFMWNVSFLAVCPLEFSGLNLVCYEIHDFFVKTQVTSNDI